MKELTIEEKAKRYDEAIEKFDVILNLNTVKESGTIFADDVRKVFPELKESEDERIKKWLINYFREVCDNVAEKEKNAVLTWLEKQGEQKPAWSEEDERYFNSIAHALSAHLVDPYYDEIKLKHIGWFSSLKDRYAWRPSDEQMRVLDLAIRCGINRGTTEETTLVSLFNDLKKLK